jgi:NADPH:quinone reductase-like Zn-dependent oxidoreductase
MKALVLNNVNQVLDYQEVEELKFQEGHSVVHLKTAALNHRDVWIQKGQYAGIKFPSVLGSDGAGTSNGRDVLICPSINWVKNSKVQPKDFRILGLPDDGTFAEQISVPSELLFDKPEHLSWTEAAALPLAGLTAYRSLFTKCDLQAGEKVLISGIGGGVALFAMQFAIAAGCEVYVTSSSDEKIEKAIALGAKGGANYNDANFSKKLQTEVGGFDVMIDSAAGEGFAHFARLSNPGGRISFFGGTRGNIMNLNPQMVFYKQISIFGTTMGSSEEFAEMLDFVTKYKIKPVIDGTYTLSNGNAALEKMAQGTQFGKLVLTI